MAAAMTRRPSITPAAARASARTLTIRPGTRRDVPTILALIRGLAEYERLAHEVRATAAQIRRHGFGRRPYFQTLICARGRTPVGFALYFFTYSTFLARPSLYLEDLFVRPEERGNGAGRALLEALARVAVRRGCGRMEWAVLDWNRPAIRFYERLGARLKREWIITRLTGAPLERLGRSGSRRAGAARPRRTPGRRRASARAPAG
jgi:GNAT superfamily N-acetyltransferase